MPLTYEDFDTEEAKQDLYDETKHSYETKDDLFMYQSVFRDDIERPPEWRAKEGEHIKDIIPFKAGKMITKSRLQNKKEGNIVYKMELFVHPRVGPNRADLVCMAQTFGQPCPICELRNLLFDKEKLSDREQKILDSNRPIRRVAYNTWNHNSKEEEDKGIQLWVIAHFFFENHVAELSKLPKGGGFMSWTHPKDGKSVMFKRKGTGATNTSYIGHKFIDRDGPIPLEILQKAVTLDDVINWPSYKVTFEMFFQMPYEKQPVTLSLLVGIPDKKDEEPDDFGEAATEETTEEPTTEEPKKEEKPSLDLGGSDEEEEEKTEAKTEASGDNPCPAGYVFGRDLEKYPECNGCPKWDDCADESDRLQKEGA
jgi:hypothetical protein